MKAERRGKQIGSANTAGIRIFRGKKQRYEVEVFLQKGVSAALFVLDVDPVCDLGVRLPLRSGMGLDYGLSELPSGAAVF